MPRSIEIEKQPQTFDVTMVFVATGAFFSADMKGQSTIAIGPLRLGNLAAGIGIDWAGIPSLGVAATIDVGAIDSSVAIFFDSAESATSMVAGSVTDLTLKDVVDTLIGQAAPTSVESALARSRSRAPIGSRFPEPWPPISTIASSMTWPPPARRKAI